MLIQLSHPKHFSFTMIGNGFSLSMRQSLKADTMGIKIKHHELGAARITYEHQRKRGNSRAAALDFAVLGYLKQHRELSVKEARANLAEALGLEEPNR